MLNAFFTAMADVVFRHEGNLDKFIGDCVMAVWGPPSPHPDDPARALRAALEMQDAVDALNRRACGGQQADRGRDRRQHRPGGRGLHGLGGAARVHRDRRLGEHRVPAVRRGEGRRGAGRRRDGAQAGAGFDVEGLPLPSVKGKERAVHTFRVMGLEEPTSTGTTG